MSDSPKMSPRFPCAAIALSALALVGCGSTFRPIVENRIDVPEAKIDVVEVRTGIGAVSGTVVLRTQMPGGTRLKEIMLVGARVRACSSVGMPATAILLDDEEVDAGVSADVSGDHRVVVNFASAGNELLSGPVALDWYDEVDGQPRCGRVAIVDAEPEHAWKNETRWSWGLAFGGVGAFEPVGQVSARAEVPLRFRYRTSDRGALVVTLGLAAASFCRPNVCEKAAAGGQKGGFSLPLGVGYDQTLFYSGSFAMGLGARYAPLFTMVPLTTGTRSMLIHEVVAVPRLALVQPRRWPSGLPGNPHGASIDLELPVGFWIGNQLRDQSFVLGGALTTNLSF